MAHGQVTTNVPAELKSAAVNGVVTSAEGVFDYNENKTQEELNQEFKESYIRPEGGIPKEDLSQELIDEINSFITNTVNNLVNYYTKDESYTKNEITSLLNAIKQFTYEYVNVLPTASSSTTNKIYLVPADGSDENNIKDEYITILDNGNYRWEHIGNTNIDLSGYLKINDIAAWAKAPNKPTYTSEEIGALPANTPIPAADNEDLQNVSGELKFADKAYNTSAHSGLGRKYLRKNIVDGKNVLTHVMVNKPNTIYVIQYDFTLGEDITVPANCILEFDGGSISGDGTGKDTITADVLNIKANSKIFSSIKFAGNCKYHSKVYLSWFISEYPVSYDDLSVDNTAEVRDCFASGALRIVFPFDRFIHLTDTIHVTTAVNILTEGETYEFPVTYGGSQQSLEPTNRCCVFSNNVITLFDYKVAPIDGIYASPTLSIGNIYLLITKSFNDLSDKDVPVLNIETNGASLWGVNIDCDIKAYWKGLIIGGQTDIFMNYTGIQLKSVNRAMTYIEINGYLQGLYRGVHAIGGAGDNWMTNITINGNTRCIYGGLFEGVAPITIYGSHQSCTTTNEQIVQEGYFTGPHVVLYGFVWDCGTTSTRSTYKTTALPVKLTGNSFSRSFVEMAVGSKINWIGDGKEVQYNLIQDRKIDTFNLFHCLLMNIQGSDPLYTSWTNEYTLNGTIDILQNPTTLYNIDNLFNDDKGIWDSMNSIYYSNGAVYVADTAGTYNLHFLFSYNNDYISKQPCILVIGSERNVTGTIKIKSSNDSSFTTLIEKPFDGTNSGYNPSTVEVYPISTNDKYVQIEVNLSIPSVSTYVKLPRLQLLTSFNNHYEKNKYIPHIRPNMRIGLQAYDFANKKPIWWTGSAWVDATGAPV